MRRTVRRVAKRMRAAALSTSECPTDMACRGEDRELPRASQRGASSAVNQGDLAIVGQGSRLGCPQSGLVVCSTESIMVTRERREWCLRRRRGPGDEGACTSHPPLPLPLHSIDTSSEPFYTACSLLPAHPLATPLAGLPKASHAVRRPQLAHPASTSSAHPVSVAPLQLSLTPLTTLTTP